MPIANDETAFFEVIQDYPNNGLALVEGDSWTSHPFLANLTIQIEMQSRYVFNIFDLSYPGHTATMMFGKAGPQLKQLKRIVSSKRDGYKFDWIILSAGGNDIVGPGIRNFVDEKDGSRYGRELINGNFEALLDSEVIAGYTRALDIIARSKLNADTPVVAHVYSYLRPQKKGTRLPVFGPNVGVGWIATHLEALQISDPDEQEDIMTAMLDLFHEKLAAIRDDHPNLVIVDTREALLKQGRPNTAWWSDEIHPTGEGFSRVAREIMKEAPQ
jgi:lysophospholipase L1-like esterase